MKKQYRLILLALFLLITLITGWRMFSLWQQETLWGHLPLLFFVSAWATIVFLFWKYYTRHPRGLRWLGLSTLSGILLSIGFPPLPLTPVLFIAWIPLLLVEKEISLTRTGSTQSANLLPFAYNTFVIWNILVTWWVGNTAFVAGIAAIWINAIFMCGPFILFAKTKRVMPNLAYAAFIAYWISFEMLHLNWELSWSWLNLGNAFAEFPALVQWYEYTGTIGGTLWILVLNVLIFKHMEGRAFTFTLKNYFRENIGGLLKITVLLLLPIILSLLIYYQYADVGRPVRVAVIQPNFEPHFEKFRIPRPQQMQRFQSLAESILTEDTDYIVFPETSFYAGNKNELAGNGYVKYWQRFLEKYPNLKLVTGVSATKIFAPGEPHTRSTRNDVNKGVTIYWEAYNAAIQIETNADSIPFYIKSKLVPGPEITPYPQLFFFLKPLINKLDGSLEGHGTQPERTAFKSNAGNIAPVICYESIFGEYHTGYIRAGAEAIFIVTNDGWWDNTAGHKQHLNYASLRAIETRRSIARSANTGISCFLNQRGDILQPTEYGVQAAISGTIKFNDRITFYVQWGDLIGRIGVFMTAILILNTIAKGYLKKIKP